MQSLINKIIQKLSVLSKAKFILLLYFLGFPSYNIHLHAQEIKVIKQQILLQKDSLQQPLKLIQKSRLYFPQKVEKIYFYAWANAFESNSSSLNKSLLENYKLDLHFTSKNKRGTVILDSVLINNKKLPDKNYFFTDENKDVLQIVPGFTFEKDSVDIVFFYKLKLPKAKITGYGKSKNKILLKDFYFIPVADSSKVYHQLNIDDLPESRTFFQVEIKNQSKKENIYSNFPLKKSKNAGKQMKNLQILFTDKLLDSFNVLNKKIFIHPLYSKKLSLQEKKVRVNKIMAYLTEIFGEFPGESILITQSDLQNHPLYGPDWLPDYINPFETSLLWELRILHQLSYKYANQIKVDKRKNSWIIPAFASFAELNYINRFYPDLSLTGNLSKNRLFKYYYISQAPFARKFPFLYLYMARINKDQALSAPLNSLSNFNREAANPSKMALGMEMLKNQMGEEAFFKSFNKLYNAGINQEITPGIFYNAFGIDSLHWMRPYINTRTKYDYKFKIAARKKDSVLIKIINKKKASLPIEIFGVTKNSLTKIKTLPPVEKDTLVAVSTKAGYDYIGINYFNFYPEIQSKNNYVKLKKGILKKDLEIRLFQDLENPLKTQIFLNPYFEYNYYDGLILGTQIHNKSILHNRFEYFLSPSYSTKAKRFSGSFSVSNKHYFENMKPFALKYGIGGSYYHYNFDLTYKQLYPFVKVEFHDPNLRKRKSSEIKLGYMYIKKQMPDNIVTEDSYYKILHLRYISKNINIISDRFYKTDLQFSSKFGKISGSYRHRWLTDKTRQMDFRIFAGAFLYNHTTTDYFSFALDRPTDYLFQYNYYGRSETTGIFHQQFIWAEGGFKSFFEDQYANQWLISNNINLGLWKWFNLYGDTAFKKNKGEKAAFYYDSGLRINLVQDYFEIFFPLYSTNGFEPGQDDYLQRIRLVFTIDLPRLKKMFTRGWY